MSALSRVPFEDLPAPLASKLSPRVARLGYFGEFFQCAAHQPQALEAFIDFTEAGKASLPGRLVELIALTCAGWMDNTYERNQHERLSVRLGFGREWVDAVNALAPDMLDSEEQQVQRLVLAVLESKGKDAAELFDQAVATLGEAHAVAVLMVIGRYVAHGLFVNTLGLRPPVPSIFEDGFTG